MLKLPDIAEIRDACTAEPEHLSVFGVDYAHLRLRDGSDLYLTEWGRPFAAQLLPENHLADREWFAAHSAKLPGTSTLFRVRTKPVGGRGKDIVLKWNRMGQDIPGETQASELLTAEFNSPFEEFSLLMELRHTLRSVPGRFLTHKPLAIYVPRKFVAPDRLGRKSYLMDTLLKRHSEVVLDPTRRYAVLYEWIGGIDAAQAVHEGIIDEQMTGALLARSNSELARRGFRVRDNKTRHIIVRPRDGRGILNDRSGRALYAMIDFELLERTPQREQAVRARRRHSYLARQARRFERGEKLPQGLSLLRIMGVDYVFGRVESSGGALWVVGDAPALFDYFLPEKWRKTPRSHLSPSGRTYETVTKDNIHLVWRISRVGRPVEDDPTRPDGGRARNYGYNDPFDEVALSLQLARDGVEAIYPRAVYMTGHKLVADEEPADLSRYEQLETTRTPDGHPILSGDHDYIVLWGYWNGPDELLAAQDQDYYRPIDARRARQEGIIMPETHTRLIDSMRERLAAVGIEALRLTGDHILLSLDARDRLEMGPDRLPRARLCSFDLLRRTEETDT